MQQWRTLLEEEWAVIKGAPFSFGSAVIVIGLLIWGAVNWSYSSILGSKNAELELADRQLGDYKNKLSGATPDQAKARIDALESQVKQFETQLTQRVNQFEPRHLSPQQRDELVSSLAVPAGAAYTVMFSHDLACSDCNAYAEDFRAVLAKVPGWSVRTSLVAGPTTTSPKGIAIVVAHVSAIPAAALMLQKAFTAAHIDFDVLEPTSKYAIRPGENDTEVVITPRVIP